MMRKYENIESRSNTVCKHLKKLGTSKKYRDEQKQFLCDGEKLLNEAVNSGAKIEIVICSSDLKHNLPENTRIYKARSDLIDSLSPLKNTQGLLFSCKTPDKRSRIGLTGTNLLLDRVQDPGNVGTIIRSAFAFGVRNVILTDGCADIYNPKTIRAAMGALFRQPVFHLSFKEINDYKNSGIKFIGTSNNRNSSDITKLNIADAVIVLGNEGQGISEDLSTLCEEMVKIPLSPDSESLNVSVAASIIMWELGRGKEW